MHKKITDLTFVMHQHEMSRMVQIMDFELFIVSGCIVCSHFNGENHFQLSSKLKMLEQKIMLKFVLWSTILKT